MKRHWIFAAWAAAATLQAAPVVEIYKTGFELEEGAASGWQGEGAASAEEAAGGSQSLKITGDVTRAYPRWTPGKAIGYVDFLLKAPADASDEPAVTIEADGAGLAFLKDGESGALYACHGAEESVSLSTTHELDAAGRSAEWIQITLRLDYAAGVYDVYVDGALVAVDLQLDPERPRSEPKTFTISPGEAGESYLDDFRLTATNPLYADRDDDGLPDAYEEANGLNPNFNDRLADRNGDGVSNIASFQRDTWRGAASLSISVTSPAFIYVDGQNGSDHYTGRMCYRVAGDGPKASLEAAVEAMKSGDVIVLLPSPYSYSISAISNSDKTINLRPLERAVLR